MNAGVPRALGELGLLLRRAGAGEARRSDAEGTGQSGVSMLIGTFRGPLFRGPLIISLYVLI